MGRDSILIRGVNAFLVVVLVFVQIRACTLSTQQGVYMPCANIHRYPCVVFTAADASPFHVAKVVQSFFAYLTFYIRLLLPLPTVALVSVLRTFTSTYVSLHAVWVIAILVFLRLSVGTRISFRLVGGFELQEAYC